MGLIPLATLMQTVPCIDAFQESYVQLTMLKEHLRNEGVAKVMERSIHSGRYVFIEVLKQAGGLTGVEYGIITQWYDFLNEIPEFDLETDLTGEGTADLTQPINYIEINNKGQMANITLGKKNTPLQSVWLLFLNSLTPWFVNFNWIVYWLNSLIR